jgi:hypothetical protein
VQLKARDGVVNGGGDETIRLKVKPNPWLYALESTRAYFLFFLVIAAAINFLPIFGKRIGIDGLSLIAELTTYAVLMGLFYLCVAAVTRRSEFVITQERVIVRQSMAGTTRDMVSVPIEEIGHVEVRSYGERFGSIYLKRNARANGRSRWKSTDTLPGNPTPTTDGPQPASITNRGGPLWIWLSMPTTSPPLFGFYGFIQYEAFARLIVDLRNQARS